MGNMYNNDVTYNDKWETPENIKALRDVEKKYFHRSVCYPSCPTAWAPEVLELMDYLDKEFGIMWNTESIMAYRTNGMWYYHFTVAPFVNLFKSIKYNFFKFKFREEWERDHYKKMSLGKRLHRVANSFMHSYTYGRSVFRVQVLAPIINKIRKPKINLRQLKEKYGRLELYFQAPDWLEPHIEYMIAKAKIKIALKGAYYPVESLYNSGWTNDIGNKWYVDDVEIEEGVDSDGDAFKRITRYVNRKPMKDLGIDLDDMKQKALAMEKAAEDEQRAEEKAQAKVVGQDIT